MPLTGQTNKLADELQDILENGIESDGTECSDGTPAYGGVGVGEDFAGFNIYSINLDDDEDENDTADLPCIIFKVDRTPIEYFHDGSAFYQADVSFEIRVTAEETKTINSTEHTRKTLVSWMIERLQFILDHMVLASVMDAGKMNTGAMGPSTFDDSTDFWFYGDTFMSITYKEEGASQ